MRAAGAAVDATTPWSYPHDSDPPSWDPERGSIGVGDFCMKRKHTNQPEPT